MVMNEVGNNFSKRILVDLETGQLRLKIGEEDKTDVKTQSVALQIIPKKA
jgi:hypothetical protein